MIEDLKGMFGYSLAGHDKGELFYIVREESDFVFVADGKSRTLDNPKKKNKKHIRLMKTHRDLSLDSEIRKAIKELNKDVQS